MEEPAKLKASILTELVAQPKTVRDRVKNQAILEEMNRGHEDDIFQRGGAGQDDFSFNLLGSSHDSEESDIRLVEWHFRYGVHFLGSALTLEEFHYFGNYPYSFLIACKASPTPAE